MFSCLVKCIMDKLVNAYFFWGIPRIKHISWRDEKAVKKVQCRRRNEENITRLSWTWNAAHKTCNLDANLWPHQKRVAYVTKMESWTIRDSFLIYNFKAEFFCKTSWIELEDSNKTYVYLIIKSALGTKSKNWLWSEKNIWSWWKLRP